MKFIGPTVSEEFEDRHTYIQRGYGYYNILAFVNKCPLVTYCPIKFEVSPNQWVKRSAFTAPEYGT